MTGVDETGRETVTGLEGRARPLPVTAITLGDAAGVGPEVAVKALAGPELRRTGRWLVVDQEVVLEEGVRVAGRGLPYDRVAGPEELGPAAGSIGLLEVDGTSAEGYRAGRVSARAGRGAALALRRAMDLAIAGRVGAVVYAPLSKEALHQSGLQFVDEIHLFASWLGCAEGFSEVNLLDDLWLFRVTSHVALGEVASEITTDAVLSRILFARDLLARAGVHEPRIAVSALNPHAGEGGLFGTEEARQIVPAIERARSLGVDVAGPYPSDTIFIRRRRERFDALLSMYHDQGQIGLKLLGFDRGVTISGGLPVTAVTPAHGTAFDIAGQGVADAGPMEQAIRVALRLSRSPAAPAARDIRESPSDGGRPQEQEDSE